MDQMNKEWASKLNTLIKTIWRNIIRNLSPNFSKTSQYSADETIKGWIRKHKSCSHLYYKKADLTQVLLATVTYTCVYHYRRLHDSTLHSHNDNVVMGLWQYERQIGNAEICILDTVLPILSITEWGNTGLAHIQNISHCASQSRQKAKFHVISTTDKVRRFFELFFDISLFHRPPFCVNYRAYNKMQTFLWSSHHHNISVPN
jgi:hypothetical protein